MSFIPIINARGRQWQAVPRVTVSIGMRGRQLVFRLTRPVIEQLNWNSGDRILVSFGIAEDAGRVSLTRIQTGGLKLCSLQSASWFQVSATIPQGGIGGHTRETLTPLLPHSIDCGFDVGPKGHLVMTIPPLVAKTTKPTGRKATLRAVA